MDLQQLYAKAEAAYQLAEEAQDGQRTVYQSLGGLTAEVSRNTQAIQDLRAEMHERLHTLERLIRGGLQKLGVATVEATKSAMKSRHDIDRLKDDVEDSQIILLRNELAAAREKAIETQTRYESIRARDKAIVGWGWKVIAGVLTIVVGAYLVARCGLH